MPQPDLPFVALAGAFPRAGIVQQHRGAQAVRRTECRVGRQIGRAGYRQQPFVEEGRGAEVGVVAGVEAHGGVDALAQHPRTVQRVELAMHAQADVRMLAEEVAQTRREPDHGEGGRAGQRHRRAMPGLAQLRQRALQRLERLARHTAQALALGRQHQRARRAHEQRSFEPLFQLVHLLADRALRHAQLAGGQREAAMARRRLEAAQPAQDGGVEGVCHQQN
ncbi:hypothetical protein D3C86_1426260 [compost metagenome]